MEEWAVRDRRDVWLLALRGVAGIVFGLVALAWPSLTVLVLAVLFGVYAVIHSGVSVGGALRPGRSGMLRLLLVLTGLLGLAVGLLTLLWPAITVLALAVLIGLWAIVTGMVEIWAAASRRGSWLLALVGLLSIVAGLLVLLRPDVGAVAIAQVIGAYSIVAGALMLAEAWRLRRLTATPARYLA
jgi:uncharacterized membrane protein HdeD (DUF308 family)